MTPCRLIHGLSRPQLLAFCQEAGQPAYRALQIWQWLYQKTATDWADMRNVPGDLRSRLADAFVLNSVTAVQTQGTEGGTRKILGQLQDDNHVEIVLIPAARRRTVCVSSQVGCRYRCTFCASGQHGLTRNLEPGEIVGQVIAAAHVYGERPTHVVLMGIGEPFDNYDAVLAAIRIINDAEGLAIGARRITISTCGIIPCIERLAGEGLQVELSVSLHAPDDGLRSKLIPANRTYPLAALIRACRAYTAQTGRIITFEYTLIDGVNDSPRDAARLAALLSPLPCRVNLIPLSSVAEYAGRSSNQRVAERFVETLQGAGTNATMRASRGGDMDAACGQLRARGLPPLTEET